MNENPKIEIKTKEGESNSRTELYIDGKKLNGVRSYRLEQRAGNSIPVLTVDLNALNLSVDGEFVLRQEGYGEIEIGFRE